MATWFAQNSSVNIDSVNQWNSAANGSGSWLTWASLGASDVLVLNGKTGIVINVDFVCGSLTAVATGGTTGGGCTVASTRSITANVICSSAGTPVITLNSGTLTVVGNVTGGGGNVSHGIHMFGSSNLLITGNVTGGTMNPLGGNSNGIRTGSTGTITIVGNVIGTTGSPAIYNESSGSITITGNVTAGSSAGVNTYGIHSVAVNSIIVTGNVTGDAVDGIHVTAACTVTVNGDVYSGAVGAGVHSTSLSAKVIVNGNMISSSTGVGPVGRVCLLISPSAQITHTYRVNNAGSAGVARSLYTGGVNLGQPVAANVRSGTTYGAASEYTGTLAVPSPTLVAIGVATDNTVGSYAPTGGLDAAGVRSAIGLASANLDTQLSGLQSDTNDIQTRLPAALEGGRIAAALDPAARVKLDASQPDYAPATVAAVAAAKAILDKIDTGLVQDGLVYQFTANMLELAPAATGVDELITLQNQILDAVNTYISNVTAAAILTPGTIVGFPETLTVGDSYTDDCDSAIQVFIRDENDDPITAVGTHDFTDGDFAPECIITQNGNTGRVNCTVTYVTASPENYLKIQIPSKESRRATPGIATVQVLLKWDGAQKALSKQTVTWEALI